MARDVRASLLDMVQAIDRTMALSDGYDEGRFLADERTQWAVYSQIVILGEAAGRLPREFCDEHPAIPWAAVTGMRHRLVHGYDAVDWIRVWATIRGDLAHLRAEVNTILEAMNGTD